MGSHNRLSATLVKLTHVSGRIGLKTDDNHEGAGYLPFELLGFFEVISRESSSVQTGLMQV